MIQFKNSVKGYCKTGCVRPEIWHAIEVANQILSEENANCVVTSLCDGKHSKNSKHYEGNAVDFRTRHLIDSDKSYFAAAMQQRLGGDYDVVLEDTHLHVEFDPDNPLLSGGSL